MQNSEKVEETSQEPMVLDLVEKEPIRPTVKAQWAEPELPKKLWFDARITNVDEDGGIYMQELYKSKSFENMMKIITKMKFFGHNNTFN